MVVNSLAILYLKHNTILKLPAFIILNKILNKTRIIFPFTKALFYLIFKFCYIILTHNNGLNTKTQIKRLLYF